VSARVRFSSPVQAGNTKHVSTAVVLRYDNLGVYFRPDPPVAGVREVLVPWHMVGTIEMLAESEPPPKPAPKNTRKAS
jgi:hypothetical protein